MLGTGQGAKDTAVSKAGVVSGLAEIMVWGCYMRKICRKRQNSGVRFQALCSRGGGIFIYSFNIH